MNQSDQQKITAVQFDEQVNTLKEIAARTVDSCLTAQFIAASDSRVRDLFIQKIDAGHVFKGIHCSNRIGIPENKYVVFDFECKPGTFCLISPKFLAVVNIVDRHVVAVVDPYIPSPIAPLTGGPGGIPIIDVARPRQVLGERMFLVLSNHASIDLWIEWRGDTHQAPQTDFLPHGGTKERKSRKVSVFDGAFFEIVVKKNDGGRPGEEIGHFTDNVFGRDHVEFVVTNINGRTFFQGISLVTVGKILLSVLLA
jgi:hypothetical protein